MPNWSEIENQFALLPLREQMEVVERLLRVMRENAYPNVRQEVWEKGLDDLANDAGIQREVQAWSSSTPPPARAKESA